VRQEKRLQEATGSEAGCVHHSHQEQLRREGCRRPHLVRQGVAITLPPSPSPSPSPSVEERRLLARQEVTAKHQRRPQGETIETPVKVAGAYSYAGGEAAVGQPRRDRVWLLDTRPGKMMDSTHQLAPITTSSQNWRTVVRGRVTQLVAG
jgi:hypothetical protein